MPQSLPPGVFFHHFLLHSARNVATWLRFCLVTTVWLGCLPYVIRQVWRLLFWFSDGGWPSKYLDIDASRNLTTQTMDLARQFEHAIVAGNGTSPVTPLGAAQTTSANIGGLVDTIVGIMKPFSSTLNISGSDPLVAGLMKSLYYGIRRQGIAIPEEPFTNTSDPRLRPLMGMSPAVRSSSLLSDVSFLNNMTRNSTLNQLLITIAEGYIITILVVVCFILVFLIREWVVQQQPGINMGAGFNAEFPGDRQRDQAVPEEPQNDQLRPGRPAMENPAEARDVVNRPMARARRRNPEQELDDGHRRRLEARRRDLERQLADHTGRPANVVIDNFPGRPEIGEQTGQNRPTPVRDALTPAAEIQRQLVEEPRNTEEFLAIWRRANGAPEEVLRIIESENKAEEMRYWVSAMRLIMNPSRPDANRFGDLASSSQPLGASDQSSSADASTGSLAAQPGSDRGSGTSDSWVDVAKPLSYRKGSPASEFSTTADPSECFEASSTDKGKCKVGDGAKEPLLDPATQLLPGMNFNKWNQGSGNHDKPPTPASPLTSSSVRPRAISDGPHPRDSISPLANNNWSFSNLDKENTSTKPTSPRHGNANAGVLSSTPNSASQSTPAEDQSLGSPAWKAAQDLRVQQAIAKGREAHKSALEQSISSLNGSANQGFGEAASELINGPIEVVGQDGITRTYRNVDELFAANPVGDSDTGSDDENDEHNEPESNPFAADIHLPEAREPIAQRQPEPVGFLGNVAEYLWGGNGDEQEDQGANDEHVVQDIAAEAPFVPVAHHDAFDQAGDFPEQDREVVEAAIAAGLDPNDPDAIDDAEDFEGIMELIGMRGPIFSLVQNALFCAFLLALTVAFGIWIPYNIGRVSLLLAANPGPTLKLPLRLMFLCAAFLQDLFVSLTGVVSYCAITVILLPLKVFSSSEIGAGWATAALRLSRDAVDRVTDGTVSTIINFGDSEMFAFSAASHEALLTLKWLVIDTLDEIGRNVIYLFIGDYEITLAGIWQASAALLQGGYSLLAGLPAFLAKPDSWVISLEVAKRSTPLDLELSVWDGTDRFWATLAGYTALSVLGVLYVKKGTPFSNGQVGREWEATIIDLLHQAGGVMKVILIISIEMLVFPLYCGLLLDAALLPLFDKATIMSRILFTFNSPLTSIFVHWFVGTCYMFHFALFVSMCRKIMRKGVLCMLLLSHSPESVLTFADFIRDPDDPTFHPVRDVLERNVATQLRKILFSALVYGALVVICLGGVVWGLSFAFNGVLPIHWSSNEPVLEFPIDLLFYNFLMPLAVRFFKPSDGLHAMYSWWFRQCARMLRLTWFMFDERQLDEEGYNVRRTWGDVLRRVKGDPLNMVKTDDPNQPFIENPELAAYFRQDGRYVRAPASDQVRIPKGTRIFLQVDELNNRIDGKWDAPDGVHGRDSEVYKQVYIPPQFRLRICAFILSIWIFAALTGVCITIVPLVFGRQVFAKLIPSHVRKNDVYAFSIGIYILGSALYAILHLKPFFAYLITSFSLTAETPRNILKRVTAASMHVARILWTYLAFIFLLPILFAFLIEFYAILPLHTYFAPNEPHTIHFVQSWTLGLLYVKLTTRIILFYSESRPAISLRAITRNGYLNPDARLATRSFILPASCALGAAIAWPWLLARLTLMTVWQGAREEQAVLVYRYVYPAVLAVALLGVMATWLVSCVKGWRMRIRDEVYLIGERLHNFGERKSGGGGVGGVVVARRIET